MKKELLAGFALMLFIYVVSLVNAGCAQIGMPTGGIKDSIAPVLVRATPPDKTVNFTGNKVSLVFDEYIELKDVQNNIFVSPLQKQNPVISYNLRTINIRFRDTLLPNTTYSVDFGNAIADINESNILRNFSYTFATGPALDSLSYSGKIIMAETGLVDSTVIAMLYRDLDDSAVQKKRPDYIARLNGAGNFTFKNLPASRFRLYALKDGDNGKTYNALSEAFAFREEPVNITGDNPIDTLFAYIQQKADPIKPTASKTATDRFLRYSSSTERGQDILEPLSLSFNRVLSKVDSNAITVMDTLMQRVAGQQLQLDSTRQVLNIQVPWKAGQEYVLLIDKDAVTDTTGATLRKTDTLNFTARKESDYGSILLRFNNLDLNKNPVLQFFSNEDLKFTYPITGNTWSKKLFPPGEYDVRILFDSNKNGIWDPGNYDKKIQPERAITLPQKISIRADWENERDINL